jgi:type I restriction enzyme S subunit
MGSICECLDSRRIPINKAERLRRGGHVPYYGANGQVGWIDDHLFDEPLVLVVEDETFTGRQKPFSYKITGKSWVNNHAHVLRPRPGVNVDYLNYSLAYYPFTPLTTGTTGRRKLTQRALLTAPLALPPEREQEAIVAEVDRRMSLADYLEGQVNSVLDRASACRQGILIQAFSGRLVQQDVNDESACVLLQRIATKKASSDSRRTMRGHKPQAVEQEAPA